MRLPPRFSSRSVFPGTANLEPAAAQIINAAQEAFARQQAELDGPALGKAYGRLGMVYRAWQFQEQARATYQNAMHLDPEDYRWPYYLALYHEEAGEFESALDALNDIDPANVDATRLYLEIDRPAQARQLLGRALEIAPANVAALELETGLANSE